MDAPESDLIVGIVGAIALAGLVVGLFVVQGGSLGETSGNGDGGDGGDVSNDTPTAAETNYHNETKSGTLQAGLNPPDSDQGESSASHTFTVDNGTYQLQVGLGFDTSTPGDLDCHLYHPASGDNRTKYGDGDCHTGTADSPQGANFTLEINASQWGDWELVVHTGEEGGANLNSDKEYDVWLSRAIRT